MGLALVRQLLSRTGGAASEDDDAWGMCRIALLGGTIRGGTIRDVVRVGSDAMGLGENVLFIIVKMWMDPIRFRAYFLLWDSCCFDKKHTNIVYTFSSRKKSGVHKHQACSNGS